MEEPQSLVKLKPNGALTHGIGRRISMAVGGEAKRKPPSECWKITTLPLEETLLYQVP